MKTFAPYKVDTDRTETNEWIQALQDVLLHADLARAQLILTWLHSALAQYPDAHWPVVSPAHNTPLPDVGPSEIKSQTADGLVASHWIRWNAMAMVLQGGKQAPELGGHIATYASSATLYDVGFDHFFKGHTEYQLGDLVYFQGHASPGMYARSFLEGRLSSDQLQHFRQETGGQGLTSYPHPWLMPNYWEFPTVSMGIGPLTAIYQARFMRYLDQRGMVPIGDRKIWVFCGDGEMDEPESKGALTIAARDQLSHLIFVVNCNLQRLDGPVRSNDRVVDELEAAFHGAGWRVIKVLWSRAWDQLFVKDHEGRLSQALGALVDGQMQSMAVDPVNQWKAFFQQDDYLASLVTDFQDEDFAKLTRGGHDYAKVHAAYLAATRTKGRPTVILTQTVKGYGMGPIGEAANTTHQQKKMPVDSLKAFAKRFDLDLPEQAVVDAKIHHPGKQSQAVKYLMARRADLGGFVPQRVDTKQTLQVPKLSALKAVLDGSGDREISTTMAFVRVLNALIKDPNVGPYIVPIVPDECRTFGMEGLFRQIGIYSPESPKYVPVDRQQVMYYREAKDGQLMQEGISEAGGFASFMAAASSYSQHGRPMIPFYIYYSMFGFQRIGDFAWAAGDMQCRGFLLGATAGRTTLAGEGLQHQDGHSHVLASTIPNCVSYDPTYGCELAVIIQHGMQQMLEQHKNIFYYLTVMNENYIQPALKPGSEQGIIDGIYHFAQVKPKQESKLAVVLLGSGTIFEGVVQAANLLAEQYAVTVDLYRVTSFSELRKDGLKSDRQKWLQPGQTHQATIIEQALAGHDGPVIAATDYIKAYADGIRNWVKQPYYVLGTDGFGRSDTRAALRDHFEVDSKHVAYQALYALFVAGKLSVKDLKTAQQDLNIDPHKPDPASC
ncbi:pyruvate dehydrogenase (acetyl-transferring), homodimeric type [Gammaproteobacteria bacterium]|nr:pyruvate dehydrogenase (acetyl-transferring), homodimeric type [Gammaproteobacteria bacterium]